MQLFFILIVATFALLFKGHEKQEFSSQESLARLISTNAEESIDYDSIEEENLFLASRLAVLKCLPDLTEDSVSIRNAKYHFWKLARKIAWAKLFQKKTYQKVLPPFQYASGNLLEKKLVGNTFSLMSFNICFTPKDMPSMFGGLRPWQQRIEEVAELIQSQNSDIICMQEIFDHTAYEKLYEKLKDDYTHFYLHIGPWSSKKMFNLGFGSGLMVASKYPVGNPQFIAFENDNLYLNRGLFIFDLLNNKEVVATVATTHLEPFADGCKLRASEMKQIKEILHSLKGKKTIILCGDLNAPDGEIQSYIEGDFLNPFPMKNRFTHAEFTYPLWSLNKEIDFSIFDYILLMEKEGDKIKVEMIDIPTFDPLHLEKAISDHKALMAQIQISSESKKVHVEEKKEKMR
jgi:endonuclease/exonuclease/phosphatase family metal-dependent hydrolase